MSEWMNEWMSEWMNDQMNDRVNTQIYTAPIRQSSVTLAGNKRVLSSFRERVDRQRRSPQFDVQLFRWCQTVSSRAMRVTRLTHVSASAASVQIIGHLLFVCNYRFIRSSFFLGNLSSRLNYHAMMPLSRCRRLVMVLPRRDIHTTYA